MSITAEEVRLLRERTGAGMMECKKALVETQGDLDAAAELMRKTGLTKADKKAARVAAEGKVVVEVSADGQAAAIVEVNCETDFVAREADFSSFATAVAQVALMVRPDTLESLLAAKLASGETIDERRRGLVAKLGENVSVRRSAILASQGPLGAYLHGTRIGVLVALEGGDATLARDIAMHVAASNPAYLAAADVPAEVVAKERAIRVDMLKNDEKNKGKPENILVRIVEGGMNKWLGEITLLGQPFVKDPDQTVGKLLESAKAKVSQFIRFEVGAGIEKKKEDFAAEVMAQVSAAGRS
jgi:elongation factor Ts